jgi:tetratricopeptide (TPR) repeat protein
VDPKPDTGGDAPPVKGVVLAPKAKKEMIDALAAMHDGKNEDARQHIEAVYKMAPGNPDVNDVYGEVLLATKEYDKAQEYLQRAISIDPDNVSALSDMGFLRLAQKDYVAGEISAQRAVGIAPQSWFAHYVLGVCELHLNQPQKAADQANLAIKAGKGQAPDAEYLLGESLAVLGKTDDAINVLQQLLKDAPDYSNAAAAKAIIAKLQGLPAAANRGASSATVPAAETGSNAASQSDNSADKSVDQPSQ